MTIKQIPKLLGPLTKQISQTTQSNQWIIARKLSTTTQRTLFGQGSVSTLLQHIVPTRITITDYPPDTPMRFINNSNTTQSKETASPQFQTRKETTPLTSHFCVTFPLPTNTAILDEKYKDLFDKIVKNETTIVELHQNGNSYEIILSQLNLYLKTIPDTQYAKQILKQVTFIDIKLFAKITPSLSSQTITLQPGDQYTISLINNPLSSNLQALHSRKIATTIADYYQSIGCQVKPSKSGLVFMNPKEPEQQKSLCNLQNIFMCIQNSINMG